MESNRTEYRLTRRRSSRQQSGITLIGLLLVVAIVGFIGLAVLKIVPLYMEKMRIASVLGDLQEELGTGGNSPASIMNALNNQFYIEALKEPTANEVKIERNSNGFSVRVHREARAPFLADLWFVVDIDEQVEISR